jgi:hypothetical protein
MGEEEEEGRKERKGKERKGRNKSVPRYLYRARCMQLQPRLTGLK